ncbi:MAG: hypothetical protein CMI58_05645 [Parcubacteria group bacterium]|nr:hypothetical protein [Parcubacteria group bacterium]|tara:strand:+ start:4145 stop:4648 length:504 start_codon:yes stop_codon:yes gene_type:complete
MCLIPKNFVQKAFYRWLCLNRKNFTHQPRIVLKRKDFFILQFSGIAQQIKCFISKSGAFEIHAEYQKEYWDIIEEFDVFETRTPDGRYYCRLCLPEYKEQFSSRKELWGKHCFEPLLKWTKENFKESYWLFLLHTKGGSTTALIREEEELAVIKNQKDFLTAFPVLK